eukprot:m.73050 g.73050  ORF g.73050 m.73050 type:complete len:163 (-) comp12354_c2_seq1:96-584(-)
MSKLAVTHLFWVQPRPTNTTLSRLTTTMPPSPEEIAQLVDQVMDELGIDDVLLARSMLALNDYNLDACRVMMMENRRASQQLEPVTVWVMFEETKYEYKLSPIKTIHDVQLCVMADTNIVEAEQMLVDAVTMVQVPSEVMIGDMIGTQPRLELHLLTPNSAA